MKSVQFLKILSFIFLLVFFTNCGGGDDDSPAGTNVPLPTSTRTGDDVRADFQALELSAGINDVKLESIVSGVFWTFRIIVPESASSSNKRPLVLSLHGGATAVTEFYKQTSCLVEPGLASLDAYIVSPNSDGAHWYTNQNRTQIEALVEMSENYLNVDTSKVAVTGYSDGGNGAWFFSQYHPNLFSAAIPMASSYAVTSQSGVTHKFADPIYVIHGSNDGLFPIATTENYIEETVAVGSDVTFVTATGLTHNASCDYISYLQDAATWLDTVVW